MSTPFSLRMDPLEEDQLDEELMMEEGRDEPQPSTSTDKLSPQPGSPALCFTPAFPASVTLSFPQHGHPNA
ncbi:UNVERIFIED_CONTAM: hypothetical protein FKN15_051705 [Acipenser sinensis]